MIDNTLFYGKVNNAMNKGNRKREKLFTLTMIMLFLSLGAIANPVEIGKARQVATTFLNNNGARSAGLTEVAVSAGFSNVYVFTTENSFVLMAADDRVQPILGYSLTGRFNVEDMPANKRAWIQEYSDAIRYAIDNQLRASSEVTQQWRDLAEGNPNVDRATTVVAPLIQTHWSQGSPYNMLCPGGSVTGCVATAMAQIMKYWNYPEHGIGSHTYTHSTYGELSADFQSTTYDWNNMINTYDYSSTNTQKMAVATLMYHCGVSVNMNYSPSSSSAGSAIVAEALKTYFNYSTEMAYHARSEYSDNVWISMLKADLNLNRPIWYNGRGSGGGHAFVFDGYNSNNYFHVNWGWGGYCDEYYVISNLNPGPGGIGSGDNGIYNEDQGAVLGIRPSECTADAPSYLTYSQNGRNVSLSWTAASGASSYQVYCNNSFIGNVSSTSYTGIAPYGSSVYYVRSVDSQGRLSLSSNAVTVTVDYPVPLVDDLAATASGNNVNLSWTAPDWCYPSTPTATLTYGEGNYNGSLGYTGSNTIYWGHRYLASNLSSYNNMKVYKVSFFANETGPYEVYVYNGTTSGHPQTQLLQQSFSVGSTGWFDIDLSTPIQIDASQDLWVFIYDPEYRNYPATYCSYYSGSEGNYYSTNPTSGVYTWNNAAFLIRTFVSDGNYTYNIFRNSFCIANNVGSTSYYDNNLPTGFYNYYVTTNYYAGETSASNQVSVQIGTGTYYTISASANPIEGGTVIGMGSFIAGQTCTLIATANEGYSFVDWTKNGTSVSTDATYSFAVTENATYVANFSSNTPQGLEVFAEYYPEANNPNSQYVRVYWTESSRFYLDNDNVESGTSKSDRSTYCVYRAYCDGSGEELIANNVTGNQYIDNEWSGLATGNYKYGVSVVDGRGNAKEIHWNDTPVIPNPHTLDVSAFQPPVTNNSHYGELRVNCENGRHNNDVTISTGVKDNRDYLQYCTDNYAGGVGTGGGTVYWGIRFPAADLTAYAGQSLTKVGIFTDTDGDYGWTYSGYYTVNVYLGGATAPGTLVSTVSEYVPGDFAWHDITLTTPVTIDATQDLWLTIYTPDIAYPMSGCDYVGNSNSDFLSLDGFTWEHSADYGLNYTWMIRGCVGEGDSTEITWSNCLWKPGNTINPQSTIGNDFWVTFLPNHNGSVNLSLIATGSSPCTGTVTNPYTNWTTEFEVSVGATTIINIPSNEAFSNGASDCVLNTSLHIVTSDFISLYASNFQEFTFDVTDVLPTPSLGSNYIIQTYPGEEGRGAMVQPSSDSRSLAQGCSEFAVIAVEDNTTVYITLTCDSQNGHYANQPFSVTLNTGECYQVKSITDGNLSGSQISVSGNKKIAVFAGNSCANVPTNCPYCDHIVEQMLPVSSWGNHFVVTGSSMRTYDIVRVTAASDDCQIFINNSLVTTINERETYQFEISSDDPSLYLETSKPAMVYLYYVGSECAGQMGDPSMVIISPIEQRMDYVTFSTFNSGASQYHFVNVITNTEDVNTVLLDGNNIASQFQTVSGNSDYSFARVAIEHGSHTLFTFGSGFVAHVYGLGDDESYAYSVGSNAAQELYTNILVNGQTASDDMNVCDNTVIFDLNYNYDVSQVNWSFGDGQTGSGIPITHEFANLGDYPVSCDVYKLDGNGNDSLVGTFSTILHIYESYYTEFEVTAHNYYTWEWMGETFYESGDYSYNGQTIHGCDSIVTLHLTITHEITATAVPEAGGTVVGGGMYNQGQTCTLSATANEGFEFMFWTDLNGAVVSYDMEYTFIVTEDMAFTAHFVGEDYCVIIFDLYDSYGDGWNGNQLVLNFDDGTTQQITFNSGSYASETLLFENGSHIVLTWISGSYIGECSFMVSYSDGTVIYEGTNLNGTSFEFNVNCNGSSDFTQVSELAAGWNWWSTYVEQEGIEGLTMLEESLGENGYQIKSQTDFVTNYGTMWFGMLSSINNEEMYMIDNTSSCQVVLTGAPVTPSDHPITVSSGWNWIGYPCTNTMSVSEAFADYTPANGDQVKSQADYAMYFNGIWIGQLLSITPGTGLMYLSNNTTSTTLVYPDGGRSTEIPTLHKATHWTNDIHAYPHNMTVMAVVELDDVELTTDNYELAAFDANGECRGSAKLVYVEPLDRHVAFLTIAGNDAVELNFGLYNMEMGREYYNMEEALVYATNATIGTPEEPYVVSFRSTTGLEELDNSVQIFPNPAQAGERINILTTVDSKHPIHVEIVNALGATVAYETSKETPASIVAPLTSGIYTVRIITEDKGIQCRKLIVR